MKRNNGKRLVALANIAMGFLALTLCGCGKSNNRFANEKIADDPSFKPYSIVRFDKEVMSLDPNKVEEGMATLEEKYGDLFDMYLQKGVEVGPATTPVKGDSSKIVINKQTASVLKEQILTHKGYQTFFQAEDSVFANGLAQEMQALTKAMQRFHHFFPDKDLPTNILAMFSCFGPKMAVGDHNELMISMEYYIGSNYPHYRKVDGINDYDAINLSRDMMVRDMMLGWAYYTFPVPNDGNGRLIDEMLYQGKLLYLVEACMPDEKPEKLMGYTKDQWEWSERNESNMWNKVKDMNHLYTYDHLTISKYINPAPHTVFFPFNEADMNTPEAPGKGGIWLGWRIIASYMANNKKATLADLMAETNSQKLLEESGYNPK
ncbi:MAG: hypothetical protein IKP37_06735 [Paludibacteraceae bacterium]|nr:hypothetical protein [Paludibacteraceae bacterium]